MSTEKNLPWLLQSRSMSDGSLVIKDAQHNEICCIRPKEDRHYGPDDKRDQQRGEDIVRAVNAHDGLVKACEFSKMVCEEIMEKYPDTGEDWDTMHGDLKGVMQSLVFALSAEGKAGK